METPTRAQEMRSETHHHPSPLSSPKGSSNHNNNITLNGGFVGLIHNSFSTTTKNGGAGVAMEIPTMPLTPKTISRSEPNPYPTTFVQADTSNFKQVVQMLTGSSDTVTKQQQQQQSNQSYPSDPFPSGLPGTSSSKSSIPPIRVPPKRSHQQQQQQQQQGFRLYERRNHSHLKNSLIINTLVPGHGITASGFSSRNKPEILSPSMLDFPKLALSPVTPLVDPFNNSSSGSGSSPSLGNSSSEEERAIAEKGFYLHPSPMSTPRDAEPQLLPLFPVTSPTVSGASS